MQYPQIPAAEIELRREKIGLTVKQIARRLRVSIATWNRWERETAAPAFVHFLLGYLEAGITEIAGRTQSIAPRSAKKDFRTRFFAKTIKNEAGCQIWTAGDKFKADGKSLAPRKAAWLIAHGEIPVQDVLAVCGNVKCVAGGHLRLGKRSGQRTAIAAGVKSAVLLELRAGKLSGAAIAAKHNISAGAVSALNKFVKNNADKT